MNIRQERFCIEYAACGNATAAAIEAGYSAHTARSTGQRLLSTNVIKSRIQEIADEVKSEKIASIEEIQAFWTDIMRDGEQKTSDRLKAAELLFRSKGGYVPALQEEEQAGEDVIIIVPDDGLNYHQE